MFSKTIYIRYLSFLLIVLLIDLTYISKALSQTGGKSDFDRGDAVRITVIELIQKADRKPINLDGDYSIDSRGYILMPVIGKIKVVGHDRFSLANELKEKYSPYFKDPYINVVPLIRVALMGAFNKPGSYRINPEKSLWELIEMADGPKENCDLNSLRIERGGKVISGNLLADFEKGYSLEDIGIKSGDQIISEGRSRFGIYEIMNFTYFLMTAFSIFLQIRNANK